VTRAVEIVINGERVSAQVDDRLSLADFIRGQGLTGTHVGCEHGVCGACTILLNGAPARSCITLAAAADGYEVETVEGYRNDPVMALLRRCFTENHALQCGYCTPGMLATAYDIVRRLPDADRRRIRLELGGNICRCTGYIGIVDAIEQAISELNRATASA